MSAPRYPVSKRIFDVTLVVPLAVLTLPLMLAITVAIRVTMGPGILFRQVRPGLGGRPFTLVKFRTMRAAPVEDAEDRGDADRLTPLGRFLRSTSLDELPTLWNVVRGEMSLVGPRPLLLEYLPLYTPEQARRHEVPPGVTGWAQVNGRNAIGWTKKFEHDVWYVDHRSMLLDLRILLRTVRSVLSRHGVAQEGKATVEFFRGSNDVTRDAR